VVYPRSQLINRFGSRRSVRGVMYEPREMLIGVVAGHATIAAARTGLATWYVACQGEVEIEVVDGQDKVIYGYFERADESIKGIKLLDTQMIAIGKFVCADPLFYDRTPSSFSAPAATPVALPAGTAPGRLEFTIAGGTNPTVTLRDATGAELGVMRFTVTLSANDYLRVVCWGDNPTIVLSTAGVETDGFDLLNLEDTFLSPDPTDSCTLETSAGTLSGFLRRAHLT